MARIVYDRRQCRSDLFSVLTVIGTEIVVNVDADLSIDTRILFVYNCIEHAGRRHRFHTKRANDNTLCDHYFDNLNRRALVVVKRHDEDHWVCRERSAKGQTEEEEKKKARKKNHFRNNIKR